MAFLLGEVSPERPGHDLQAGHGPGFPAQPGKVGGAGVLSNPGRLSRSCPHRRQINPQTNQSHGAIKAPWLFCWVGRFRRSAPGMTRRRARAGIPRTARQGAGAGVSRLFLVQTRTAYSWIGFPLGGSFGISNRCDKKSVFYKSVSQPL